MFHSEHKTSAFVLCGSDRVVIDAAEKTKTQATLVFSTSFPWHIRFFISCVIRIWFLLHFYPYIFSYESVPFSYTIRKMVFSLYAHFYCANERPNKRFIRFSCFCCFEHFTSKDLNMLSLMRQSKVPFVGAHARYLSCTLLHIYAFESKFSCSILWWW